MLEIPPLYKKSTLHEINVRIIKNRVHLSSVNFVWALTYKIMRC